MVCLAPSWLPTPSDDLQFIPGTQTLWLELAMAARYEAVVHLDDLLLRRTRLGIPAAARRAGPLPRIRACASRARCNGARKAGILSWPATAR
jgi:glycerol-3-phosphate dehydrogenase